MANKAAFTAEEWKLINGAPHTVAMAIANAGGGVMGAMKEAFSAAQIMAGHMNSNSELLRAICNADEIKAAEGSLRDMVMADPAKAAEKLKTGAIDQAKQAVALLAKKAPAEAAAYKTFLNQVAEGVANAAKEGGFLGIGGQRVSSGETELLKALADATK